MDQTNLIPLLQNAPDLTDVDREALFDAFHGTKSPEELEQALQGTSIPPGIKQQVVSAKAQATAPQAPSSDTAQALLEMSQLPPEVLEMAESHPKTASAFIAAASKRTAEAAKGNEAAGAEGSTLKPDIPPTPEGHALVQASDGGLHHIPAERVPDAKKIDPTMVILHIEPKKATAKPSSSKKSEK